MIIAEKAPNGILTRDAFEVLLIQGESTVKSDVYLTLCPSSDIRHGVLPDELKDEFNGITDGGPATTHFQKSYFTGFTADTETEVRVKINCKTEHINVIGKEFSYVGDTLSFKMSPGEKTAVLVKNDFGSHLSLSCDEPCPLPAGYENIIELKEGLYSAENCEYIKKNKYGAPVFALPSSTLLYLHRGAVLNASILIESTENSAVMGNGIIYTLDRCYGFDKGFDLPVNYAPLRWGAMPSVYVKTNSKNIIIKGITLMCEARGITVRNCENICIEGVNIFTSTINSDGINMVNVKNISISGCFIISDDDCVALYTNYDSIQYLNDEECKNPSHYSANVKVRYCLFATGARTFCIGGHASGATSPHDILENFSAENITAYKVGRIVHSPRQAEYWSGPIRILSQTEQYVRNIKFKNIRQTQSDVSCGKLIHIEVRGAKDASYTESQGYRIENVEISDVEFFANHDIILPCLIKSPENSQNDYCVDGVRLKNIVVAGERLIKDERLLKISGNVKNITIE